MGNSNFSNRLHSFFGISGSIVLFAAIIVYARMPTFSRNSVQVESLTQDIGIVEKSDSAVVAMIPLQATESNQEIILQGGSHYQIYCASCHGLPGQERTALLIGSDLFDAESTHGSDAASVRKVIEEGVITEGMVPWKAVLNMDQIESIVSYLLEERVTVAG